jgi:hypothetical protein
MPVTRVTLAETSSALASITGLGVLRYWIVSGLYLALLAIAVIAFGGAVYLAFSGRETQQLLRALTAFLPGSASGGLACYFIRVDQRERDNVRQLQAADRIGRESAAHPENALLQDAYHRLLIEWATQRPQSPSWKSAAKSPRAGAR